MSRNVLADRSKEQTDEASLSARANDQSISSIGEIDQHLGRATPANFPAYSHSWIPTEGGIECGLQDVTCLRFRVELGCPADVTVRSRATIGAQTDTTVNSAPCVLASSAAHCKADLLLSDPSTPTTTRVQSPMAFPFLDRH
jgi:hypothetical protein